jgi:hypothetical protein
VRPLADHHWNNRLQLPLKPARKWEGRMDRHAILIIIVTFAIAVPLIAFAAVAIAGH